jgi:hypothetical protein
MPVPYILLSGTIYSRERQQRYHHRPASHSVELCVGTVCWTGWHFSGKVAVDTATIPWPIMERRRWQPQARPSTMRLQHFDKESDIQAGFEAPSPAYDALHQSGAFAYSCVSVVMECTP